MTDAAKLWAGPAVEPSAEELGRREAIGQLAKIYALGIDLRDYDLCRSAFAAEAVGEERGAFVPIEQYLKGVYGMAASFHATQTLIAQQYIRIDGDDAEAWSYAIAYHKVAPGEARDEIIAGVQYRDRCHRFERGWLITERRLHMQWLDLAPARAPSPPPPPAG